MGEREQHRESSLGDARSGRGDRPWVLLGQGWLSGRTQRVHPVSNWEKDHKAPADYTLPYPLTAHLLNYRELFRVDTASLDDKGHGPEVQTRRDTTLPHPLCNWFHCSYFLFL